MSSNITLRNIKTKRIINLAILFVLIVATICRAEPRNFDMEDSFKRFIEHNMHIVLASYEGKHYRILYVKGFSGIPFWCKSEKKIDPNYKFSLEKAVGTLEVAIKTNYYRHCSSKERARESSIIVNSTESIFKFTIEYQDDKWVVTKAMEYVGSLDKRYESGKDIFIDLECLDDMFD